ncbi:MAG: hypothetical protein GX033_01870 [Firmicutes bacterium]|jgi:hypothetical protein|nr:hypothetical protein [Bacillota bacterium]
MIKRSVRGIVLALTFAFGLLLCLFGCSPKEDIIIPTLFYHNTADNQLDVQIGHINCSDGTVQWQGETLYKAPLIPEIGLGPDAKLWDGTTLVSFLREEDGIEVRQPDLMIFPDPEKHWIYGKGCIVEVEYDSEGQYAGLIVCTKDGLEARLSPPEGKKETESSFLNLVLADYTAGQVTLIFLEQWPEDDSHSHWENYFHCLTYDFASEQTAFQTYEVRPGADLVGNSLPTYNNGIIEGKYYFRDGLALASLDLQTGKYAYYEQYKSAIFDRLLPQEKINGIKLYDVTAWEDCLLLNYDCTDSVDKKTGAQLPSKRITIVWQNGKPQATLAYEYSNAVLTVYDARGKALSETTFPADKINTKMFSFQLPSR